MRSVAMYLRCFLLIAAMAFSGKPAFAKDDSADYLTPYNALLTAYVHDGEKNGFKGTFVDYKGWATDKNHAEAMKRIGLVKPSKLTGNALKAFWINAYNLFTIDLIVRNPQVQTIKNIGTILDDPWKTFTWQVDGRPVHLHDIDHGKLPVQSDPRLYFALADSALSGPNLRKEAYTPEQLDSQIDTQISQFLNDPKKGIVIRGTVLEVSKLFQSHGPEFEAQGGTVAFLRHYHPATPVNGVVQGYLDYDWALNGNW